MAEVKFKNRLLANLEPSVVTHLSQKMTLINLPLKTILIEANTLIDYVFFPEDCVVSVLALTDDTQPIEVGMVGFEGMSDMVIDGQADVSPLRFLVQIAGSAWRVSSADFCEAIRLHPSLAIISMKFKQVLAIQFAFTAFSHGTFSIEERLARWLLMSRDRHNRDDIPLVHEFLAAMLAVRRSGVTTAIHVLEGRGAIRARRGLILIKDRSILEEVAGSSYGVPESEYERLFAS